MKKVTYPGSGNNSQFVYDGLGRNVSILEYSGGSLTSTKQFVWAEDRFRPDQRCEARNSSGAILSQYFSLGETISGTSYFYTTDNLGSVREMTNGSGAIQNQLTYDPFGRMTQIQGTIASDFQYIIGTYAHLPSGLNLALTRFYDASLGRWLNRDFGEEEGGVNLYRYVVNDPISQIDPSGLAPGRAKVAPAPSPYKNCYVGDASCCGYNRNRCNESCPPCDAAKAASPDPPLWPSTAACFRCCAGHYSCCMANGLAIAAGYFGCRLAQAGTVNAGCSKPGAVGF